MGWARYATTRAGAAKGLFWTLIALVAMTTGVLAGTVGITTAQTSAAARDAVDGDRHVMTARTRLAPDPDAQERLGRALIRDAFAPARVFVDATRQDGRITFRIAPDVARLDPDDLPAYSDGATQLKQVLKDSDVNVSGVDVQGDLREGAAAAARQIATSQALGTVPLSVLALVTVLAVAQVARLLSTSRERETALLVARGASGRQVFGLDIAESTATVLAGGALGTGLAVGGLAVTGGVEHWPETLAAGLVATTTTWLMVVAMLAWQVRVAMRPGFDADRSGRTSRAVAGVSIMLVLALAALSTWQLLRTGSPLTLRDGRHEVNVVAGAAPALLLGAVGVIALGLLGPLGALATRIIGRGRGAAAFLASAQVARRIRVHAVPVVLTVLASGSATTAALYSGTSDALRHDLAAVASGAPIRTAFAGTDVPTLEGVDVVPVWTADNSLLGDMPVTAIAANPGLLAGVITEPDGMTLLPDTFAGSADPTNSIPLPAGSDHVRMRVRGELVADQWTMAYLEHQKAEFDAMSEWLRDTSEVDFEQHQEDFRLHAETTVKMLEEPVALEVDLSVRDPATGSSSIVTAPLTLPGPTIEHDADTFSGFRVTKRQPVDEEVEFDLDASGPLVIDAISFRYASDIEWIMFRRMIEATVSLHDAHGAPLFGERTAKWASSDATSPEKGGADYDVLDTVQPRFEAVASEGSFESIHNMPSLRPLLDNRGEEWRLRIPEDDEFFWGSKISAASTPAGARTSSAVGGATDVSNARAVVTDELAQAASLRAGDTFQLQFMNRTFAVELVDTVTAIPGIVDAHAVLLDADSVSAAFAASETGLRPPSELWASADDVRGGAAALGAAIGAEVQPTDAAPSGDPARSARLIFWVACAGAMVLAATGIAVATAALASERRPEVAVLRALGMSPAAQASSRVGELAAVVASSLAFGVAGGWFVSLLVVPSLAQATVGPGQVSLPSSLTPHWGGWLLTLGAGAVLVGVVGLWLAARVRTEATDVDYREEVR